MLVAEESAGIQVLRALARTAHRVVAVLTQAPTHGGGATVASVARTLDVPVLPSEAVRDPELAGFVADEEIHWMDPEIDTGPIAYSTSFDITEEDTGLSVSAKCVRHGIPLVERLLEVAAADPAAIQALPQDLSRRSCFRRGEIPDDGRIVWSRPACRVVDLVRACDYFPFASPWREPTARLGELELAVLKTSRTMEPSDAPPGTVRQAADGAVAVATGDEWIVVHRVRLNGRPVPAAEVLDPGDRLADGA